MTELIGQTSARRVIFIAWEDHRRTREICGALAIERHILLARGRGLRRYATLVPRTLCLLARHRSATVIVQNPSLVLSTVCLLMRPFLRLRVIMDAHNEAIEPFLNPHPLIARLARWLQRNCDFVIVTNRFLAQTVLRNGGRPIVLPDRIPEPAAVDQVPALAMRGRCNVVVISTFVRDEPLEAVLDAARRLGGDFQFYITGNSRKLAPALARMAPANVTFTGYLDEQEYWSALRQADLIVDLSLMDNCLVCGAYEAVAVGTPLVLSTNSATLELFSEVAHFADNSPASIASAIRQAHAQAFELRARAPQLREKLRAEWQLSAQELQLHFGS
jgi:glycosyltransferase involved in cell wall biosynthesis